MTEVQTESGLVVKLDVEQWQAHLIGGPHAGTILDIDAPYPRLKTEDSEYTRFAGLNEAERDGSSALLHYWHCTSAA